MTIRKTWPEDIDKARRNKYLLTDWDRYHDKTAYPSSEEAVIARVTAIQHLMICCVWTSPEPDAPCQYVEGGSILSASPHLQAALWMSPMLAGWAPACLLHGYAR